MKNRLLTGIVLAILGILIVLVPIYIFPVCTKEIEIAAGGTTPMKCFWSGRAEIGIGLLILCSGILLSLFKNSLVRVGISIMTALIGIVGILIPHVLIGGCKMEMMPCRMATFPALTVLNALVITIALVNSLYLWKKKVAGISYE